MGTVTVDIDELKKIVSEMVDEQFRLKMMELRLSLVPYVSNEEQREIEEEFGKKPTPMDVAETWTLEIE